MNIISKTIKHKDLLKHETKGHILLKFLWVFSIFIAYFLFITFKYWIKDWLLVSTLSWSFFVLCTPVADAWFLIDFPLRLITKIKMLYSEILVWIIAILLNLYAFFQNPEIYQKTDLLSLFKHILDKPFPFYWIILLSLIWTFVSVYFWDELMDKVKHKERSNYEKHKHNHSFIIMLFIIWITLVWYDFLLKQLWVELPI